MTGVRVVSIVVVSAHGRFAGAGQQRRDAPSSIGRAAPSL